jgi:hypothetical protein
MPIVSKHAEAQPESQPSKKGADYTDAGIANQALNLAELSGKAFVYSALQAPAEGISQLVNHLADSKILPILKLVEPPAAQTFASKEWLATTIASGFGMVAPFLLVRGTSARALGQIGRVGEASELAATLVRTIALSQAEATSMGRLANSVRFLAPPVKMALDGAIYGSVLTPSPNLNQGFWEQRGISAASSALTFGAMGLASRSMMVAAENAFKIPISDLAFSRSTAGIGFRLSTNAAGGSIGGAVSAESTSLLSGNGHATREQIVESMAAFMVTGAALDGVHIAGDWHQAHGNSKRIAGELITRRAKAPELTVADRAMLENLQKAHFEYFREHSDKITGLTKDRSTETSPASIAAVGFSLTAHGIAAERGWISREGAADYTLKVLKTLWQAPQGQAAQGTSGDHGLFYHFLNPKTGLRAGNNEISTIDTALLMSGVLFSKNFFDANLPKEREIRELSTKLFSRVDWNWATNESGRLSMGWTPENGFIKTDWRGYDEASILLLLGIGSPTHPLPSKAWDQYHSSDIVSEQYGHKGLEFGPLFGHQYTQVWVEMKGIRDAQGRKLSLDYFDHSRAAVLKQHEYAVHNPGNWRGYGALDWGLTASDGPGYNIKAIDGRPIEFQGYAARGFPKALDDGTIAPTAAAASIPFAPELVLPTLKHWVKDRPEIMGRYGFQDAFNPTYEKAKPSGWVAPETLGIDQGPILLMIENYLSGSVWQTIRQDKYLNAALTKAGFRKTELRKTEQLAEPTY